MVGAREYQAGYPSSISPVIIYFFFIFLKNTLSFVVSDD